jgi:DNA replication protein DnaC
MSLSPEHHTPIRMTPEELESERRESLRKSLWISSLENTFENFRPAKGSQLAYKQTLDFARGKAGYSLLLIYGGVGNGKTHLCEATAIELLKRGIFCRVLTWPEIIRALKKAMQPEAPRSPDDLIDIYCKAKHLILDDIGAGMSGSEFGMKELEEIVEYRYHEKLFTMMTTNRDIKELPERVLSRLKDKQISCLILNEGEDYRRKK